MNFIYCVINYALTTMCWNVYKHTHQAVASWALKLWHCQRFNGPFSVYLYIWLWTKLLPPSTSIACHWQQSNMLWSKMKEKKKARKEEKKFWTKKNLRNYIVDYIISTVNKGKAMSFHHALLVARFSNRCKVLVNLAQTIHLVCYC